jgi:hypothetical protein
VPIIVVDHLTRPECWDVYDRLREMGYDDPPFSSNASYNVLLKALSGEQSMFDHFEASVANCFKRVPWQP